MTIKTYNQNCGLAAALDVVGERWTLLVIRALLSGSARFGEIQAQLPGMGPNLLSARLKLLSRRGLIEKRDGAQGGYALTAKGEALKPIVQELAAWGRDFLPVPGGEYRPEWTMFNIESAFRPDRAEGLDAVVEFLVADEPFHLVIHRKRCRAVAGRAHSPDLTIRSVNAHWLGQGARLQIHGDAEMFDRVRRCFDL